MRIEAVPAGELVLKGFSRPVLAFDVFTVHEAAQVTQA
jgi:hypothetical protein